MELYKGQAGSPVTNLASAITATQTTITVNDGIALPDAPNIATIWSGTDFETFRYGAKTGNTLSDITRGVEGSPMVWAAGTEVARFFTAYDHQAIIDTIKANKQEVTTHLAEDAHIVESGSNANGTYIKYQNGIMQCWLSRDVHLGDHLSAGEHTRVWTFPQPFVGNYYCNYQLGVANANDAGKVQGQSVTRRMSRTNESVSYRLVLSANLGSAASDELFAIGRWK